MLIVGEDLGVYKPAGWPGVDEAEKAEERTKLKSDFQRPGGCPGLTSRLNRLTVGYRAGGDAGSKPARSFLFRCHINRKPNKYIDEVMICFKYIFTEG